MYEMIINEEKSEDRKQKILSEIEKLFSGLTQSLEAKSREQFNSKFTSFKTFLFELNSTA
jgi:hypothetical protein